MGFVGLLDGEDEVRVVLGYARERARPPPPSPPRATNFPSPPSA